MSRDDDDLIKGGDGEDFSFEESEEFSIPETPYADDEDGIESELPMDDMEFSVDATAAAGEDFEIPDIELEGEEYVGEQTYGHEEGYQEQFSGEVASGPEGYEPNVNEPSEDEEKAKPGWMLWAGFGAFLLVSIGAMVFFVLPMFGGGNSGAPKPDAMANMPMAQQSTSQTETNSVGGFGGDGSGEGSGYGGSGGAPNDGAPVQVSAFPVDDGADAQEGWVAEPTMNETASAPIPDPQADVAQPEGRFNYDETRTQLLSDRAAEELEGKLVAKSEFQGLKQSVRENLEQLDSLAVTVGKTEKDIADLDRRVSVLERKVESGYPGTKTAAHAKGEKHPILSEPEKVKDMQRKLAEKNYRPGNIDGIFGTQTQWAIKRAQKEHGLEVTGRLDDATIKMLDDLKLYTGSYPKAERNRPAMAKNHSKGTVAANGWFLRGLTAERAIVYRKSGESYPVSVGTEVPGMGQVLALHPDKHEVVTAHGIIRRQ
ncbi:peptidoglycan-binding domain-containing protein [Marinobacter sp. MBR-105]